MLFKTHLMFSIFLFLTLFLSQDNFWIFFIGILLGTIIVDIDIKNSKIGKYKIFRPLQIFLKHRGIMHTIFMCIILTLITSIINIYLGFSFFVGYFGHLLLDCITKDGIKLFYPISQTKIKFIFKTNGPFETILFSVLIVLNLIIIYLLIF